VACESTVPEDIDAGTKEAMPAIVEALTKPLTVHEKAPKWAVEPPPRVAFKGNYQDVNRFFYRHGWTDGLPIVPPTEEAVKEMMQGTDLPPDHVVAKVIPRQGKATIEKIAINAVMAGALPTHMPVIIAAIEAFADHKTRFDTFEVSTGSWAPFFAINGPIRHQIHINCSSGALSPGDIANAAIGRRGRRAQPVGALQRGAGIQEGRQHPYSLFPEQLHADGAKGNRCTGYCGIHEGHESMEYVLPYSNPVACGYTGRRRVDKEEP
jgi:hypothetical protein